jgi:hypothetical protein
MDEKGQSGGNDNSISSYEKNLRSEKLSFNSCLIGKGVVLGRRRRDEQ